MGSVAETNEQKVVFDAVEIQRLLPHRYPFLLVDKIIELKENESIVGIKNVTINEPFFTGHFPSTPVMPGVLILESMAQVGCILSKVSSDGAGMSKNLYFVGADQVRWKRTVVPGDTLRIAMRFIRRRRGFWEMEADVTVDGKVVCSGKLMAMETDDIA